ncbi:Glucuronate isomerase/ uronic isomerase [Alteracholeplasma palmae J233]|uniref:Uronate isomerase n=1 Tax=Alteracholeplasma palmae (strain ATCC 49389 / J233) TaxID=1318466 RepID=U4KKI1_ALTPJ|nr:glucuronate isomerase [Alteracholeplasma palmae]CCV64088.1 Glucuronate isomerase/ uronic isomerase [Alteracholeplasma palmae J233]
MKTFINDDFLLHNEVAKKLFHDYAKDQPIIDYHCHLSPKEIYEDKKFRNLFDAWLSGDHYKWRLLRANGVTEDYITGDKPDYEKFLKWAELMPTLIGSPLYHWTHLELKKFFNIDTLLSPKTALEIWNNVNKQLETLTARKMITMSNVETIVTTDDPVDDLAWHKLIKEDKSIKFKVLPAFRPDKAFNIELSWFASWIETLSKVANIEIKDSKSIKAALRSRIEYFHERGCRLSDHALDVVLYEAATDAEIDVILAKGLKQEALTQTEIKKYKGYILTFLGQEYHRLNWVQQYHIGALRNNSKRMLAKIGPDTGFDSINDGLVAEPLAALLGALDETDQLPKTIIYTLNPRDFEVAITLMQSFQGGGIPGKIQFGSSWWFLDSIDGMTKQFVALGNNGLLARFVGMLTDSRSFLSYPRHEYFRRLLCNVIGEQVVLGYFPEDYELLSKFVKDISYNNAKEYFSF